MRISLAETSRLLNEGRVVAVPTETVYGLAASLANLSAIEQIYSLKGRPSSNPLIVHVADPAQVNEYLSQDVPDFQKLAEAFWPGPMTLVLPIDPVRIPEAVRAGLPTAAFRVPSHPLIFRLLALTGPLVMPSANLSGRPSSTCAEHVEMDFGSDFPILDGGACSCGVESTILAFDKGQWKIARQGVLSPQAFEAVLGYVPSFAEQASSKPLCPGQLFRHYSPKARLHLLDAIPKDLEGAVIGFSCREYPSSTRVIPLGPLSAPEKIAENLYAALRQLDAENISTAWVDFNFPCNGILATVAERLKRAAS